MTVNYSTMAYARERYIMGVSGLAPATRYVRVYTTIGNPPITADYATRQYSNAIDIDLTDIIASDGRDPSAGIMLQELDATKSQTPGTTLYVTDPITCRLLTRPQSDIIPRTPYEGDRVIGDGGVLVPPPSYIINSASSLLLSPSLSIEVVKGYAEEPVAAFAMSLRSGRETRVAVLNDGDTYTELILQPAIVNPFFRRTRDGDMLDSVTITMAEPDLCRQYALVQWQSRYGGTKRLAWELRDLKNSITTRTDLDTMEEFDVRKEYDLSATLHLPNLCPYDYWYYADIVYSNDVRIMPLLAGEQEFRRVDVTTKSISIPNGQMQRTDLNVTVTLRNYGKI